MDEETTPKRGKKVLVLIVIAVALIASVTVITAITVGNGRPDSMSATRTPVFDMPEESLSAGVWNLLGDTRPGDGEGGELSELAVLRNDSLALRSTTHFERLTRRIREFPRELEILAAEGHDGDVSTDRRRASYRLLVMLERAGAFKRPKKGREAPEALAER